MPYDSYSLETWLRPVWHTREMYNETVLFVGEEDEAPLLYRPSEIRSVRSYGLNVEYTEGKDYILTEEGKIRRLRGSAIPYFETDEYYRKEPDSVPVAVFGKYAAGFQENRYIKYGEKDTFTSRQIAVTYAHDCVWEGSIPEDKSDRAGKFLKKLEGEKAAKIVFYGDSITAGCNASGTEYGGNTLPYTPSYAQMVASSLEDKYAAKIECVNTSLGGANTEWGLENVEKNVISHAPDLVVIAFGMNDADLTVAKYKRMISEMIDKIHAAIPDWRSRRGGDERTQQRNGMVLRQSKGVRCGAESAGTGGKIRFRRGRGHDRHASRPVKSQTFPRHDGKQRQPSQRFSRARLRAGRFTDGCGR